MTEESIKKLKKDYKKGMKYNDLMSKYNITQPELRSIIRKNKLTRTKNEGHKNALGNKGGNGAPEENKNAVVTGEYENIYKDVLEEDELELYENYEINDAEQLLIEEYKILTIREKRMLQRIKDIKSRGKDMTINYIRNEKGKSTKTITDAEPTINLIQRIEDGLTRVQEAKRRCIESLARLNTGDDENKTLNVNLTSTTSLLESINRQLGGGQNGK